MSCSCLLWARRELGSSLGLSSPGSRALQPRSPQPGPTPGFCLGWKPKELCLDKWEDTGSQHLKMLKSGAVVSSTCPEPQPPLCAAGQARGQGCKCRGHGRSNLLRKWDSRLSSQSLFPSPAELPEDCHQLFLAGQQSSGIFQVQPAGSQAFKVYCDMTAGKAVEMSPSVLHGGLANGNPK